MAIDLIYIPFLTHYLTGSLCVWLTIFLEAQLFSNQGVTHFLTDIVTDSSFGDISVVCRSI